MDSQTAFFIAAAASIAGQFLDARTTEVFLGANAGTEGNPISSFVVKKFGMSTLYIVKCVVLPVFGAVAFAKSGHLTGVAVSLIIAAGGFIPGVYNYLKLKKAGVKVF